MAIHQFSFSVFKLEVISLAKKQLISTATGFVGKKANRYYLITNKHVVTGKHISENRLLDKHGRIPAYLSFEIPALKRTEETIDEIQGKRILPFPLYSDLEGLSGPLWKEYPTDASVDIACIDITEKCLEIISNGYDDMAFDLDNFDEYPFNVMGKVFVIGFPASGGTLPNNFPIYKSAYIASEPNVKDLKPYILLDGKTKSGMSGSPVVIHHAPEISSTPTGTGWKFEKYSLIGVYSGRDIADKTLTEAELGLMWPISRYVIPAIESFKS